MGNSCKASLDTVRDSNSIFSKTEIYCKLSNLGEEKSKKIGEQVAQKASCSPNEEAGEKIAGTIFPPER